MGKPEFFDELLAPAIRMGIEPRANVTKGDHGKCWSPRRLLEGSYILRIKLRGLQSLAFPSQTYVEHI